MVIQLRKVRMLILLLSTIATVTIAFPGASFAKDVWCVSWKTNSPTGNMSLGRLVGFEKVGDAAASNFANDCKRKYQCNADGKKFGLFSMSDRGYLPTDALVQNLLSGKDVRCGCYIYQPASGSKGWAGLACYDQNASSNLFESLRKYQ